MIVLPPLWWILAAQIAAGILAGNLLTDLVRVNAMRLFKRKLAGRVGAAVQANRARIVKIGDAPIDPKRIVLEGWEFAPGPNGPCAPVFFDGRKILYYGYTAEELRKAQINPKEYLST